jgi:hypothetical protein
MLTNADAYHFVSTSNLIGEECSPPTDAAGWMFGGFHAIAYPETGEVRLVSVWTRPKVESSEGMRQRLLAELLALVAPLALTANSSLAGLNQGHGAAFLDAIGSASGELQALIKDAVAAVAKG